jgi:hypothetical protein
MTVNRCDLSIAKDKKRKFRDMAQQQKKSREFVQRNFQNFFCKFLLKKTKNPKFDLKAIRRKKRFSQFFLA